MIDFLVLYSDPTYAKPVWTNSPPKGAPGAPSPEGAIGQVYGETLGSFLVIDLDAGTAHTFVRRTSLEAL